MEIITSHLDDGHCLHVSFSIIRQEVVVLSTTYQGQNCKNNCCINHQVTHVLTRLDVMSGQNSSVGSVLGSLSSVVGSILP